MKKINELKANVNEVEIFEMPEIKLIGKEIRCGGVLGNRAPELWDICIKDGSLDVIKKLPSIIPNALLGWSGNYTEEDKLFSYIVGVFSTIDTVVPEGFACRILPATLLAKGIYNTGYAMVDVYTEMGYTQNYELSGWNSELYFYKDDPEPFRKWSHITPVRLTSKEQLKKEKIMDMDNSVFDSEFSNVKYVAEDNVVFLTWKKFCCYEDYRKPATFALELLKKYPNSNFVVDARNGFEDEKEDVKWGFSVLLPAMSLTDCKKVVFIMNEVNDIEQEMDMWTKEFMKYFTVKKVKCYLDAVKFTKAK